MLAYILRRLFWFIPVFFVVTALTFWTVRELPGGPFDFAGEKKLPEHVVRNIQRKYGLDKPVWQQYLNYLRDLTRLDFGVSFKYRDREVSEVLGLKVVQILRAETSLQIHQAEDGSLTVMDLGREYPLQPGDALVLRDGTILEHLGSRVSVERRQDFLLKMPLRPATIEEGGVAVPLDGELVSLEAASPVELPDGTQVRREGATLVARNGEVEIRLGETPEGKWAVLTPAGDLEPLEQRGVGYDLGQNLYVRLAPAEPVVIVGEAVVQINLQPVLVARVGPGEVAILQDGQPLNLPGGARLVQEDGIVTVTTSMAADALLQNPTFDIPIERLLAVDDGRGNLVPLAVGTRVELPDGTVVSGQGEFLVVQKQDLRIEVAEGEEDVPLVLRDGEETVPLSDRARESNGVVILADASGNLYLLRERMRLPLVRYLALLDEAGGVKTVLRDGDRYELPDGTRLVNRAGEVTASREGEKLVLGWTGEGQLAVMVGDIATELKAGQGEQVELDKRTTVTYVDGVVAMQRRLDVPIRYDLYPQDGGWAVWAAGLEPGQPMILEEGRRVELPGDMTVRWKGDRVEVRIQRVSMEGKVGLPISAKLGLFAMAIAIGMGIPLGIVAALRHNTIIDYVATFFAILGVSVPNMVLGPLLILFFIHPDGFFSLTWTGDFRNYILPAFALGTGMSASIARLTRASLLQVIREDYIRTAQAKGLSGRAVVIRHALKNSLIPVVTILGPMFAAVVTGTLVIEQIFTIPGMGKHFVLSITNRDYPIVMAVTIIYAVLIVLANLFVDIAYGVLDPRIRYQ